MSRMCEVTGKKPMRGNHVPHANNKRKRSFMPNIHVHRYWVPNQNRFVRLKLSTKAMRLIDKIGIEAYLNQQVD